MSYTEDTQTTVENKTTLKSVYTFIFGRNIYTVRLSDIKKITLLGHQFIDEGINFIKVESLTESGKIIPNKVAYISEVEKMVKLTTTFQSKLTIDFGAN